MKIKKLKIKLDFVPTDIIFLVGDENISKYIDKMAIGDIFKLNGSDAKTIDMTHSKKGHRIIIGIEPQQYCTYQVKGLIVHEIAHTVDFIIERHGFEGYEFRAYLQQHLYIQIMKYYDKEFINESNAS